MPQYRRAYVPGGSFFLTLVTHERRPLFQDSAHVDRLRQSFQRVMRERPFTLDAAVVLPDHLHLIMTLPVGDADFSFRIGRMKALFTKSLSADFHDNHSRRPSRIKHRERAVWQRRFWEHTIRSEIEFARCADYIHYNPVKHGFVSCPHEWKYSSFLRSVERGWYTADWACVCLDPSTPPPDLTAIEKVAGE